MPRYLPGGGDRTTAARRGRGVARGTAPVPRELACMIRVDGSSYCIDPVGGVADALGKKWTLPLIGVLGNREVSRFGEIVAALQGVGAKALADRLRELKNLGLVERTVYAEVPSRVEYRLTARGNSLRRALIPLLEWAAREPGAAPDARPARLP